jgi:hypothetical protein
MARTKFDYLSSKDLQTARDLMATRNWQDNGKTSFVERIAVLQLMIDWGQGRHEAPDTVQEVISDLHIGSGNSGYSDSERINLILAYLAADHDADEVDEHGVRYGALYATLTNDGLGKLIEWLQAQPERAVPSVVNPVDENLSLHPNVRRALKSAGVTDRDEIAAVLAHCHFMTNISGGTQSGWVHSAAQALRRAGGAEALRQQDNEANEALMARDRAWRR